MEHLKLSQSSQQAEQRRAAIREELAQLDEEEGRERLEMQEAQHALQTGAQAIEVIVQRLQSLEEAARAAQQALSDARTAITSAERAHSEAEFHERSCHEKVASSTRLAASRTS